MTEKVDSLSFWNAGDFYDGEYEDYIDGTTTPKKNRNPFLVRAMVNIKMIDSQGYGIHTMFSRQKERYLPMPDYSIDVENGVLLTIPGKVIDIDYSVRLIQDTSINLTTAVLLDRVQKHLPISDEAVKSLRKQHLIEGRKPNFYLSDVLVSLTSNQSLKAEYIKNRNFDDNHYREMILQYIKKYKKATKKEIKSLIIDKLSPVLSDKQKESKVQNLLSSLRRAGKIEFVNRKWILKKKV